MAALGIALLAAAYTYGCLATTRVPSDFEFWWRAAGLFLDGVNPYLQRPQTAAWPLPDRFFYPMPTVLASLPVARLPLPAAGALMLGVASGALAWHLARDGWWRLWALASPAFIIALKVGQWSPLLCLVFLVPRLGGLAVLKPTLGAALLGARVAVGGALAAGAIAAMSIAALPSWPKEWLDNLRHVEAHPAPIVTPLGVMCALALLRWRRPEARLLFCYACVPQLLFFADQLPLALVARDKAEAQWLSACGLAAWLVWIARVEPTDYYVLDAAPYVILGVYVPALILILRRPNDGKLPAWVDQALTRFGMLLRRVLAR